MKIYSLSILFVLIFCMCNKPVSNPSNPLAEFSLQKMELLSPYLKTNIKNELTLDWKTLNNDIGVLRIIPKDTIHPASDFCIIFRRFRMRCFNCLDEYDNDLSIRCVDNMIFIYRHYKKNRPLFSQMSFAENDDKLTEYISKYKGKYVPWNELKKLIAENQSLFGYKNKVDSIEFVTMFAEKRSKFIRYYSIWGRTGEIYNTYLPLDTVINFPLKNLASRFYNTSVNFDINI